MVQAFSVDLALTLFSDSKAVACYAEGPVRQVPGLVGLQQMTRLLLAERVPPQGRVLVLGAGGGQELKVFADACPDWRFIGIDPSAEMLALARTTLGSRAQQVDWVEGTIDDAPVQPCDGATCLLTLHFLTAAQRLHALIEVRRRLKPGAPFVVVHHSIPEANRTRWLDRYADFSAASGIPERDARNAALAINSRLPLLTPQQDEALLREAGFESTELFYAGFTFRGWVAYAPG